MVAALVGGCSEVPIDDGLEDGHPRVGEDQMGSPEATPRPRPGAPEAPMESAPGGSDPDLPVMEPNSEGEGETESTPEEEPAPETTPEIEPEMAPDPDPEPEPEMEPAPEPEPEMEPEPDPEPEMEGGDGECVDVDVDDLCAVCACDSCLDAVEGCYANEHCVAVVECARQTGCDGLECIVACGTEIDAAGGLFSEPVMAAKTLGDCRDIQCADACG
jgi:hypothetical protein